MRAPILIASLFKTTSSHFRFSERRTPQTLVAAIFRKGRDDGGSSGFAAATHSQQCGGAALTQAKVDEECEQMKKDIKRLGKPNAEVSLARQFFLQSAPTA